MNQFQPFNPSPMVFEVSSDEFYNYQYSLDSPDLRPIALPMSGHDKSFDGMINLQNAAISFPDSDAFAQYAQPDFMPRMSNEYVIAGSYQEGEPEYYSDSDFGYSLDYEAKTAVPVIMSSQVNSSTRTVDSTSQSASRKRKASLSSEQEQLQPQKKVAVGQLHVQDPEGDFYELNQPSPYSPYIAVTAARTANNSPRSGHHYSTSNASQVSLAAPSPHTPAWSPSFTTVKTEHSPRAPVTPIPRPASTSTPYSASMPKLVRTSTIPQLGSPGLGPTMATHAHTRAFNPYAMYPQHKASLHLKGDLDGVAKDWSEEELETRRKLIVFTRCQNGSVIEADFKVVPQDEWQRGDITVNCIWWKEHNEAFVTSVDTIALLEQLVAVRFTVEEKNRIRRNLEGFRPLTVSKAKTDSEDFFKIIMGFPNPKPRNIEKDVKVFPWKILAGALKKIISKYSASYSSTASTLMTPAASIYASTEHSTEYQLAPSPGHEALSQSMPPAGVPVLSYEQHMMPNHTVAPGVSNVHGLSVQVPSMLPPYEVMHPYTYDTVPMGPYALQMPQPAMSAPAQHAPSGWNFDNFIPAGGVMSMQPISAPASAYPRTYNETAEFIIPPQAYQQTYHH